MKNIKQLGNKVLIIGLFLLFSNLSYATWSVVILDSTTNTIGMAGASCTYNVFGISKYITANGVVMAQAVGVRKGWLKAINMIIEEAHPKDIIDTITNPEFDPEVYNRQYAIASFKHFDTPYTFTGDSVADFKVNAYTAPGISVQGNCMANEIVVKKVFEAVVEARNKNISIEETLMIALEVGSKYGGDIRCGEQTARSAFIQVGGSDDNNNCPYLDLQVYGIPKGGQNPIKLMRKEFDYLKKELQRNKGTRLHIIPSD